MARGMFITVDGPGGIGKSTLTALLAEHLRSRGARVHTTREPSDRPIGAFTRAVADSVHGQALACLVAADRYDHLAHEINPRLEDGQTVVCDRYLASTLVLQRADGVAVPFLLQLNAGIVLPDVAVVLTADPAIVAERLRRRGAHHRFEVHPDAPRRECALYKEAVLILRGLGVAVAEVDIGTATPSGAVARIAACLTPVPVSLDAPSTSSS